MLIKLIRYNGDIRYIKKEDVTITQEMLQDADAYLIDENGKTIEKIHNYKGLEVMLCAKENVLIDEDEDYEDLCNYDAEYLIKAAFSFYDYDLKDIYELLNDVGIEFEIARNGEIINS